MYYGGEILKTEILKCTGLLIGLIFVLSLFPQSAAAVVWSDNFDDGNYDGWTVEQGNWIVSDGTLMTPVEDWEGYARRIWHTSSQVVGTWSFDAFHPNSTFISYESIFLFVANGSYINGTSPPDTYKGYGVRFFWDSIYLVRMDDGDITSLGFLIREDYPGTWTHIDVTRNSTGGINVYINATSSTDTHVPTTAVPDLTAVDTVHSYSEKFLITDQPAGNFRADNITVDDEIWITPPVPTTSTPTTSTPTTTPTSPTDGTTSPPIDTTLLIVGAGVAGVVIVAVVVLMRKR